MSRIVKGSVFLILAIFCVGILFTLEVYVLKFFQTNGLLVLCPKIALDKRVKHSTITCISNDLVLLRRLKIIGTKGKNGTLPPVLGWYNTLAKKLFSLMPSALLTGRSLINLQFSSLASMHTLTGFYGSSAKEPSLKSTVTMCYGAGIFRRTR